MLHFREKEERPKLSTLVLVELRIIEVKVEAKVHKTTSCIFTMNVCLVEQNAECTASASIDVASH